MLMACHGPESEDNSEDNRSTPLDAAAAAENEGLDEHRTEIRDELL